MHGLVYFSFVLLKIQYRYHDNLSNISMQTFANIIFVKWGKCNAKYLVCSKLRTDVNQLKISTGASSVIGTDLLTAL